MQTITLSVDDGVLERACRVAKARGTSVEVLVSAALRLVSDIAETDDPILGSMHEQSEAVDEMLAIVTKERERRWLG